MFLNSVNENMQSVFAYEGMATPPEQQQQAKNTVKR